MNTSNHTQLVRVLGLIAAVGAVGFVVVIAVAGFAFPHYSHIDQMISELGGADATHPLIQNLNFVLFGASAVGLAVAIALVDGRIHLPVVLLAMLGVFGTAAEGVVHCDSGCLGKTSEGALHLTSGLIGFVAGVVALFVFARRWRDDQRWATQARFTRWCARGALAGLVLFIASGAAEATSVDGLAQRIFAAPLLLWVVVTGSRLFSSGSQRTAASTPQAVFAATVPESNI